MILVQIHSALAYLVLAFVFIFVISIFFRFLAKVKPGKVTKKIGLIAMIATHIQVLLGIALYFISNKGISIITHDGFEMSNSGLRFYVVEHPFAMILGVVLLTITYSKVKRANKTTIGIFLLAIASALLLFSRVPYDVWL